MKSETPCPCSSNKPYETCCKPLHNGEAHAPTAQALMRSRYAAFAKQEIEYLKQTTWPPHQKKFDEMGYLDRAKQSIWLGLVIEATEAGQETDTKGTVTFTAKSMFDGEVHEQHEKSLFKKKNGKWHYVKPIE